MSNVIPFPGQSPEPSESAVNTKNHNKRARLLGIAAASVIAISATAGFLYKINKESNEKPDFVVKGTYTKDGSKQEISSAVNLSCNEQGVHEATVIYNARTLSSEGGYVVIGHLSTGDDRCADALETVMRDPSEIFDAVMERDSSVEAQVVGGTAEAHETYEEVIGRAIEEGVPLFTYTG